jgi:glycosyltransferase involved in cell wall biosynthesis
MDTKNVTIIIPALNEEAAIFDVVRDLKKNLPGAEVIVIDDGSIDGTALKAKESGAVVISHKRNKGYGASLKTGVRASIRPYVLFCDADGQHSFEDVMNVIDSGDGYDMVVGARDWGSHIPRSRLPGKFILSRFANILLGQKIPDFNSGLRMVKKDILLKYFHLFPDGFSMSTTMLFAFLKSGYDVKWVPINARKRKGKSSVSQVRHGLQTLMLMLRLTVLFEPLKVFLWISTIFFITGVINLFANLVMTAFQSIGKLTIVLFISALVTFMFGLLCDQVSALRRELHD